nr:MAG TPA: hypothetical protein [Caudoviricetes sp.]
MVRWNYLILSSIKNHGGLHNSVSVAYMGKAGKITMNLMPVQNF